ncbi:CPBP family intramembrane metalloprotease [Solihabitans fulvus]|uniref:CPBP family intramembrane metalloprotease n=1 Tax=Solihabitans fulvus TaxID=1892852 RepID=A0A5B2XA46_9PSEU|nr:type II CAAX endopeptidase family protein [Solihabitans fulvus]KAA2260093.1 CPBP family intramembrane metalloprotease [Solihabitans fulvus]
MTTSAPARQRSGLALYFAVTFATTWALWLVAIVLGAPGGPSSPIVVLGAFGPAIGAIVVRIRRAVRRQPAPARTVPLRLWPRLLLVLPMLVLTSATVLGGALLASLLGGPAVSLTGGQTLITTVGGPVPFVISMLIAGPLAEEPGWRGTAYPRMRASMGRIPAALLLGVVWAVWHVPLFFIPGTVQATLGLFSWSGLAFMVSVIPMALLTGYAYERAGVAASIAVHFAGNVTLALLSVSSPVTQAFIVAVQVIVAIPLLALHPDRQADPATGASNQEHASLPR